MCIWHKKGIKNLTFRSWFDFVSTVHHCGTLNAFLWTNTWYKHSKFPVKIKITIEATLIYVLFVRDRVNMLSQVNEVEKQNKSTFFFKLINMMTMVFLLSLTEYTHTHTRMSRSQSLLNKRRLIWCVVPLIIIFFVLIHAIYNQFCR